MINLSPPAGRCFLLVIQFAVIAMSGRGDGLRQAKTVQLSPPRQIPQYYPCGIRTRSVKPTFKPTVVNVAPNGMLHLTSEGTVARIDSDGVC